MVQPISRWPTLLAIAATAVLMIGGCSQRAPDGSAADTAQDEFDPHDVPITAAEVKRPADYADAVARITSYCDQIRDEIDAGRPAHAHRPLDELNFVLEWLPEIARDSGIPASHWEEINVSAQRLAKLFDQVHAEIDAKQDPDYGAISGEVEEIIERLRTIQDET